jgi:RNA recognition motif-containing protein
MYIFIGRLHNEVTEQEIIKLFSTYGKVEQCFISKQKVNHRSRGYGFVLMMSEREAQEAISKLDGYEFYEVPIMVKPAREGDIRFLNGSRPVDDDN